MNRHVVLFEGGPKDGMLEIVEFEPARRMEVEVFPARQRLLELINPDRALSIEQLAYRRVGVDVDRQHGWHYVYRLEP